MNIHTPKGLTPMEVNEIIEKLAADFAKSEAEAQRQKVRARRARKHFEALRDAGVIGFLECQTIAGGYDALTTQFEADLFHLHRELTKRARELDVDLPSVMGGGDR